VDRSARDGRRRSSPYILRTYSTRRARLAACAAACVACAVAVTSCGTSAAPAAPAKYEVRAASVGGLGRILTDGAGFTLYMYAPDHQGRSVCSGFCARSWPPLLLPQGVTRPIAGPGIRTSLLGTTRRANSELQVTYDKWPLYLWEGDTAAGQATGQADDMGLWYVLSVNGTVDRGTPTS
jgi:predicted lipoprotein with Yx(FWY)xxD motif